MTGIRIEQTLFEDFFRATLPRLASHLDASGLPLSIVTTNWFMCLFVNTLPAETLLRVWDLLILEDSAVLVRVGGTHLPCVRTRCVRDHLRCDPPLENTDRIPLRTRPPTTWPSTDSLHAYPRL